MNTIPEEERFAKNVGVMISAIQNSVTRLRSQGITTIEPGLITFAAAVINGVDKNKLIQKFIEKSHLVCWDQIKDRNETFFIENAGKLFDFLPADKVNLFRDLYTAKDASGKYIVPKTLKEQIWKLFDAMIKISIKYIHRHRSPYSYQSGDEVVEAYGADFFDEVNLAHHGKNWGLNLEFPARY